MGFFWENFQAYGDTLAFINAEGQVCSYGELEFRIQECMNRLTAPSKQLVFLYCKNNLNTIVCYLSCLRLGYPVLLLDQNLDLSLKETLLGTYQPNLLLDTDETGEMIISHLSAEAHVLDPALAVLLSTSGSTGEPKLVKLSKNNLQSNAGSISGYLELSATDRAISLLPFHYSYGLSVLNTHLYSSGSMVLTTESIMSREFWALFKSQQVTSIAGVPYIYEILEKLRFSRMQLPSLRYMTQAGGKLATELVLKFSDYCAQMKIPFYVMYGQTEATARISYLDPDVTTRKPDSIGKPIPGGRLHLKNESGEILNSPGLEGEMIYQGPNVMIGYAESLPDLQIAMSPLKELRTGDIAYFDDEGDYFIVGRSKRFIKLYGLRFSLDQLEKSLKEQGFECICGGADDHLQIAVTEKADNLDSVKKLVSSKYKININSISAFALDDVPRLSSGKIDYKAIFK